MNPHHRIGIRILVSSLLFAGFIEVVHAQYLQETGSPTFATTEDVAQGFVNVANGNLHIEIPIVASPQRGGRMLTGKMVYDSRIWKIVDNGISQSWQPTNVPGTQIGIPGSQMGWRFIYTGGGTAVIRPRFCTKRCERVYITTSGCGTRFRTGL